MCVFRRAHKRIEGGAQAFYHMLSPPESSLGYSIHYIRTSSILLRTRCKGQWPWLMFQAFDITFGAKTRLELFQENTVRYAT